MRELSDVPARIAAARKAAQAAEDEANRRRGEKGGGCLMADVADCIDKLVTAGQITRKIADEATRIF